MLCEISLVGAVNGGIGKTSPSKSIYDIQTTKTYLAIFVALCNIKVRCLDARSPTEDNLLLPCCFFGYQIALLSD